MAQLNMDILQHVMRHMTPEQLYQASSVCKDLKSTAKKYLDNYKVNYVLVTHGFVNKKYRTRFISNVVMAKRVVLVFRPNGYLRATQKDASIAFYMCELLGVRVVDMVYGSYKVKYNTPLSISEVNNFEGRVFYGFSKQIQQASEKRAKQHRRRMLRSINHIDIEDYMLDRFSVSNVKEKVKSVYDLLAFFAIY